MLSLADLNAARARIAPHIHRTPVMTSRTLDAELGARLFFKCENFQKIGAFKARGATNAVFSATDKELRGGVVTHSSGNHAAALARAARLRGVPGHIVIPTNAPRSKVESVRRQGGEIIFCEPNVAAREEACARVQAETGALLVHPYDDWRVIAGQGTAALELMEDAPDLDVVIAPVGGGGLMTGTTLAVKSVRPSARVFAAEPEQADDAARSLATGVRQPTPTGFTIADGVRTGLGEKAFSVLREKLDGVLLASEAGIIAAMRHTWEILKILIEPSCALPLAALREGKLAVRGLRVGIILSGGNLDLDRLPWQEAG